jgi:hypothetical protein
VIPDHILEAWQNVARTVDAHLDFVDQSTAAGRYEEVCLHQRYRHWDLNFKCTLLRKEGKEKTATVFRSPIIKGSGLRFNLYEEKMRDRLLKIVGLQDILIGDQELDRRYIIQANDEKQIQDLMSIESVRKAFESPFIEHLRIIDDEDMSEQPLPPHMDLLYGKTEHRIAREEVLLAHYTLFTSTLDALLTLDFIKA